MDTLLQDIRFGLRLLRRAPGFTAVAVVTLALGIGGSTAIFSVVNAVLLRPLPYPESERLVEVWTSLEKVGIQRNGASPPELLDVTAQSETFAHVAGLYPASASLFVGGRPEHVQMLLVSPSAFPLLEVQPALGRTFADSEAEPGRETVVVLSHGLWQRQFASDPNVLGRSLSLDGNTHTVVGVMPAGFQFPIGEADLWAPLSLPPQLWSESERGSHFLKVIARLGEGVSLEQGQAAMQGLAARLDEEHPATYEDGGFGIHLGDLHEQVVGATRTPLLILLGAVGFVVLIACANVANLLLAEATGRQREMALRDALGARRGRLIRQLLTESVLLALAGCVVGLLIAVWGVQALRALGPADFPRLQEVRLDLSVLAFSLSLAVMTGIAFGLAPALLSWGTPLQRGLNEMSPRLSSGRWRRLRGALVAAELALALVLLAGSSLLMRSLLALENVNPGLRAEKVATMRLVLPEARYPGSDELGSFRDTVIERLAQLPGVDRAAAVSHLPLGGLWMSRNFTIKGPTALGEGLVEREIQSVVATPDYFGALGIPLLAGRDFTAQDTSAAAPVVIIDEGLARRLWPNESAIGREVHTGGTTKTGSPWRTIVGVVGQVRHQNLADAGREQLYFPFPQLPPDYARQLFLVIKAEKASVPILPAAEKVIHGLDPELAVIDAKPMAERLTGSVAQERFRALLLGVFATMATLLAIVGIYGVMAYSVTQRGHEIGIRVALGAQPRDVVRLVLRQGMVLLVTGVVAGLAGSLLMTRVMESMLFGVSSTDGVTFAAVPALLMTVAFIACWIPARRATRVDPLQALRSE